VTGRPPGADGSIGSGAFALNGLVSLAGNVLLMRLLVGTFGVPPIAANVIAVLACSIVNYVAGDRVVFRTLPR
jgi:putative flippase GtrA